MADGSKDDSNGGAEVTINTLALAWNAEVRPTAVVRAYVCDTLRACVRACVVCSHTCVWSCMHVRGAFVRVPHVHVPMRARARVCMCLEPPFPGAAVVFCLVRHTPANGRRIRRSFCLRGTH
jgi:hypothetical protein